MNKFWAIKNIPNEQATHWGSHGFFKRSETDDRRWMLYCKDEDCWNDTNVSPEHCLEDLIAIKELEAQMPKWISVDDRLPENNIAVLVYGDGKMTVAHTEKYLSWVCDDVVGHHVLSVYPAFKITHWMPLPEVEEIR